MAALRAGAFVIYFVIIVHVLIFSPPPTSHKRRGVINYSGSLTPLPGWRCQRKYQLLRGNDFVDLIPWRPKTPVASLTAHASDKHRPRLIAGPIFDPIAYHTNPYIQFTA